MRRLQDELTASKKREEVKAAEAKASHDLAVQIRRRSKLAEAAKADTEAKLSQLQEKLQKAQQAAQNSRRRAAQWKCRYAAAKLQARVPSTEAASPEIAPNSSTGR